MNFTSHLLVLSHPDFLERQFQAMLDEGEPASLSAARRIRRWIARSA
jgi:hypothetical protein